MKTGVTKKGDAVAFIGERLDELRRTDVLVGIPADATQRKGSEINNASLLFVLTHGSPVNNIPPTPIIEPSIERNKSLITPHLADAAKAILDNSPERAEAELRRAGTIAMNGAKRFFTEPNGWPPNAPSTIAKKGSNRRNIDTSQLRRAITYALRKVSRSSSVLSARKKDHSEGEVHFSAGAAAPEGLEESAGELALSVIEVI